MVQGLVPAHWSVSLFSLFVRGEGVGLNDSHPSLQFVLFESAIRLAEFETVDSVILITGQRECERDAAGTHHLSLCEHHVIFA